MSISHSKPLCVEHLLSCRAEMSLRIMLTEHHEVDCHLTPLIVYQLNFNLNPFVSNYTCFHQFNFEILLIFFTIEFIYFVNKTTITF